MVGKKEDVIEFLSKDKEGDIYEIKRKKIKSLRSLRQNRYYFGVVVDIISNFHGYTRIETHELLKATFGLTTLTDLDTKEFKELMEIIIEMWKEKYEVIISLPKYLRDEASLFASLGF